MFFGLMIATLYLYALALAALSRQRNTFLILLAVPPGLYLFFGPR